MKMLEFKTKAGRVSVVLEKITGVFETENPEWKTLIQTGADSEHAVNGFRVLDDYEDVRNRVEWEI